jgi:hypothetical protein
MIGDEGADANNKDDRVGEAHLNVRQSNDRP